MVISSSRVTAQGQISVPAEVRRRLGLGPGSVLEWVEDAGAFRVQRAGRHSSQDIHQALFAKSPKPKTTEQLKDGIRRHLRTKHARS